MHCYCCDVVLTDYEATLQDADTGEYLEVCLECLRAVQEMCTIVVREADTSSLPTNGIDEETD